MGISDVGRKLQDIVIASSDETSLSPLIAKRLLNFLEIDFSDYSLEDLASYCLVSPASLSRFIQKIGYRNYQEFKEAVTITRKRVHQESFDKQKEIYSSKLSLSENSKRYAELIRESIQTTELAIHPSQMDKICQQIHDNENIYLFGVHSSGDILRELQYAFLGLGKLVNYYDGRINQKEIANRIENDSMIIVLSVGGNFFRHISNWFFQLNFDNCQSVLITANKTFKLRKMFDEVIDLGVPSIQSTGIFQAQFLVDLLFARYRELYDNK
ncbi:MAG: hypothetical protein LBM95_08025 [Lactobacillales bacterium]|jgi:DNA-binding MurR/RpiR family transcriptional regulator|nr:hypothetical protein [Lactobacillales bacterium]